AGSKNSKTPILLLPVRIETRFMKSERPDHSFTDPGLIGTVLENIHVINAAFLDYRLTPDVRRLKDLLQLFSKTNKQLRTTAHKIGKVTKAQKTLVENVLSSAVNDAKLIVSKVADRTDRGKFEQE